MKNLELIFVRPKNSVNVSKNVNRRDEQRGKRNVKEYCARERERESREKQRDQERKNKEKETDRRRERGGKRDRTKWLKAMASNSETA